MISDSGEDPGLEEEEIVALLGRRVEGLIIASTQPPRHTGIFRRIEERKVPYVLIDRKFPGLEANFVGVNDEEVGALATEHLIEKGCRVIAHIRGPQISTALGRLEGYRRALARYGLEACSRYIVRGGQHEDHTGYEAMRKLLRMNPRPDGVFCFNDPLASGALEAVFDAGVAVPDEIAIMGVGNVHYSNFLRASLSTVDQSSGLIGQRAAELLLELSRSKRPRRPRSILLPPKIVVRDSTLRQCRSNFPKPKAVSCGPIELERGSCRERAGVHSAWLLD